MEDSRVDREPTPSKRKRAPNFTDREIRILMKLVFTNIDIIESKKPDSETWKVKDIIWNNITENFNACSGTTKRSVETIRQKYDSVKKIARKKDAKNKEEEGNTIPDYVDMEGYEKELMKLLEVTGNNNSSIPYETLNILPDAETLNNSIKSESILNTNQGSNDTEDYRSNEGENFTITDDDMLWDLPSDMVSRPRLTILKKHVQKLEKDMELALIEHDYKMKNLRIQRRILMNQERRAKAEHQRQMALLELEIMLKRKKCESNITEIENI